MPEDNRPQYEKNRTTHRKGGSWTVQPDDTLVKNDPHVDVSTPVVEEEPVTE